jgi:putative tricarboxylic transport membrane protein
VNRYDKKSSLIWFLFSLLVIAGTLSSYSIGSLSKPGPGFLPLLCALAMATLSLVVFFQSLWKERQGEKKFGEPLFTPRWPKIALALSALLAYFILLEPLGYLTITFLFILGALKVIEPGSWRSALAEAIAATLFSYILFEVWLKVLLPKGFWPALFP